jgi:hypothetical protein
MLCRWKAKTRFRKHPQLSATVSVAETEGTKGFCIPAATSSAPLDRSSPRNSDTSTLMEAFDLNASSPNASLCTTLEREPPFSIEVWTQQSLALE